MRLKVIVYILVSSLACANAQKRYTKFVNNQQSNPISSIKQIGDSISVNQMMILKNENLNGFIQDIQKVPLTLSRSVHKMPSLVRSFLESFCADKFTIANPDADWNCCCDQNDSLPNRKLICSWNNEHLFMISYLTGGIATTQHLVLVKYNNKFIKDFWTGIVEGNLNDQNEIIKSLKANKIQHWASKNRISL